MLLTATNRLARLLRADYDAAQRAAGRRAWAGADILPWHGWLEREWSELSLAGADAPALLDEAQQAYLWRSIIRDAGGAALVSISATAAEADRACAALYDYRLAISPEAWDRSPDAATFRDWHAEFRRRCAEGGWLSRAELAAALTARLAANAWRPPREIELAGFSDLTPAQNALVAALCAAGVEVRERPAPVAPAPRGAGAAGFADAEAEMRAAARWARAALEAGETGRIGIVVPEFAGRRAALERIFADALQPAAILPGQAAPLAFNISLAPPLAAHPLARAALAILRLAFAPLSFAAASTLLRSPFWSAESEWTARAALEADLRRFAGPEIALDALLAAAGRSARTTALAAALRRARAVAESQPRRQGAAAWAEAFAALLETAGWPGERPLDSAEFQTAAACRDLIATFARLEAVAAPLASASALEELEQLAAARLFQPESPETPVQILGLLESAGLEFARLWVMGLDADSWPLPPRPPAFLPLAAAIEGGVPRATPRSQHELARREQERLLAAAREVVLSYPQGQEDVVLSPSPLLAGVSAARSGELDGADATYASRLLGTAVSSLVAFTDEVGPPAEPAREYHGGAKLLADQAACPFRAFAHWRLGAASLDNPPQAGLDYVDRGTVVHLCLARYAGLRRQGLAASLVEVVRGAVEEAARKNPALRRPELADGEHRRLLRLLEEWVATMEPCLAPYAVHAVEADMAVELAGLRLRVRMDRVDRASDGGEIVLDFKTGEIPRRQPWEGARPDEPQVPLYAAVAAESAVAAAFALVKPGQMCFSGMADRDGLLPGAKPADSWPDQLQTWRAALEGLAREFLAGRARVAPKYGEDTCRFCDARPLCRIADFAPAALGDSESEEPGE